MLNFIASNDGNYIDSDGRIKVDVDTYNKMYQYMESIYKNRIKEYKISYNVRDYYLRPAYPSGRRTRIRKMEFTLVISNRASMLIFNKNANLMHDDTLHYVKFNEVDVYMHQERLENAWKSKIPSMFIPIEDNFRTLIEYMQCHLTDATSLKVKDLPAIDSWLGANNLLVNTILERKKNKN